MGSAKAHQLTRKGKSVAILYVGIDLAKNVFAIDGRSQVLLAPSLEGIEASARRLGWPSEDFDHFIHPGVELSYGECLFHVWCSDWV